MLDVNVDHVVIANLTPQMRHHTSSDDKHARDLFLYAQLPLSVEKRLTCTKVILHEYTAACIALHVTLLRAVRDVESHYLLKNSATFAIEIRRARKQWSWWSSLASTRLFLSQVLSTDRNPNCQNPLQLSRSPKPTPALRTQRQC